MPRPPRSNPQTKHFAVELRHNLTPAERKLWTRLRNDPLGVNFRRHTCPGGRCQGHAIGPFITDFCCVEKKLIIELDGGQHLEQAAYDAKRTAFLESQGYQVLRFWNNEALNELEGMMQTIFLAMEQEFP